MTLLAYRPAHRAVSALRLDTASLVSASATYLDGPGREYRRTLAPPAATRHAALIMRLTTNLVALTLWLDGHSAEPVALVNIGGLDGVPGELRALAERQVAIARRIYALTDCEFTAVPTEATARHWRQ